MTLPNVTVTTQDWLNGDHTVKVNAYLGGAIVTHSLPPVQIPFEAVEAFKPSPVALTRKDLFGALGAVARPVDDELEMQVDRQLESDVEAGKFDELAQRALEAYRKGEVTEL